MKMVMALHFFISYFVSTILTGFWPWVCLWAIDFIWEYVFMSSWLGRHCTRSYCLPQFYGISIMHSLSIGEQSKPTYVLHYVEPEVRDFFLLLLNIVSTVHALHDRKYNCNFKPAFVCKHCSSKDSPYMYIYIAHSEFLWHISSPSSFLGLLSFSLSPPLTPLHLPTPRELWPLPAV